MSKRVWDFCVFSVLLLVAMAAWGPVYGDHQGYVAAGGGVFVGLAVAWVGVARRFTIWLTFVLGALAYMLCGGFIALSSVATSGFLPNGTTLGMLLVQTVSGWKDLLTLTPPAGAFVGPTVLPYFVGVVCAIGGGSVVLRSRRAELSLIFVVLALVTGILFGSRQAPLALVIGVVIGVLSLMWWSHLVNDRRVIFSGESSRNVLKRRRNGAVLLVLIGAVTSAFLTPIVTNSSHRYAVRDHVIPPLDVRDYSSPLAEFRSLIDTRADDTLFTVEGLAQDGRVRLATLDVYNGIVYNTSTELDNAFRRIGTSVDTAKPAGSEEQKLDFSIDKFNSVWVPGSGVLTSIDFTGERSELLLSGIYYSSGEQTLLSTNALAHGDTYSTHLYTSNIPSDKMLEGAAFGTVLMPENTHVPSAVVTKAEEILRAETSPIKQARALEQYFQTNGYYAVLGKGNGAGNQTATVENFEGSSSRPGHRNQRIQSLLESDVMEGDDEQYAVAMALMARSAHMPARVVMGFYPDSYDEKYNVIKGTNTHVWVEINFDGYGWVPFDPSPPRNKIHTEQTPVPKPNPRPLVVQPPDPPDEPSELTPLNQAQDDPPGEDVSSNLAWVKYVLIGLGILILVLGPFLVILFIKLIRTRRRRNRGRPDERAAGAWEDILDTARDGKYAVDPWGTRYEQALSMNSALRERTEEGHGIFEEVAQLADLAVFSPRDMDETEIERTWEKAEEAKNLVRLSSGRMTRYSLRSLRRRKTLARGAGKNTERTGRAREISNVKKRRKRKRAVAVEMSEGARVAGNATFVTNGEARLADSGKDVSALRSKEHGENGFSTRSRSEVSGGVKEGTINPMRDGRASGGDNE